MLYQPTFKNEGASDPFSGALHVFPPAQYDEQAKRIEELDVSVVLCTCSHRFSQMGSDPEMALMCFSRALRVFPPVQEGSNE